MNKSPSTKHMPIEDIVLAYINQLITGFRLAAATCPEPITHVIGVINGLSLKSFCKVGGINQQCDTCLLINCLI